VIVQNFKNFGFVILLISSPPSGFRGFSPGTGQNHREQKKALNQDKDKAALPVLEGTRDELELDNWQSK